MKWKFWEKAVLTLDEKAAEVISSLRVDVEEIEAESDSALDSFRLVKTRLDRSNAKIEARVALAEQQMTEIAAQRERLMSKKVANDRVKAKIDEFLG